MSTDRQAAVEWARTMPVRMTVDVYAITPRRPTLVDEPVVSIKGVVGLHPTKASVNMPLWFSAKVKLYQDGSAEILEFGALHGSIHGPQIGGKITDIYELALRLALVDTKLRILDVVR